jgi:hypothetical protein
MVGTAHPTIFAIINLVQDVIYYVVDADENRYILS